MHESSYNNMKKFTEKYLKEYENRELRILDIGSQDVNGTYKPLFDNPKWSYFGCDMIEGDNVDIVLKDIYNWGEIKSNSFDIVISGQAFEHIEYTWVTMLEISRVLKDEGMACIIAPSGGYEHRYPLDCWRFYPDGFNTLAKYSGLNTLEVYTQWDKENFPDLDETWKDTVLICKKPTMRLRRKIKFGIKNKLTKIISSLE